MNNHSNKKTKKFWGSWRCNILLLFLSIIAIFSIFSAFQKYSLSRDKYKKTESELANLSQNKEKLESSLSSISTPFGQEKVFRDKFNVVKEGEGIIIIVDEEVDTSESEKNGFFDVIFSVFSKKI